jgi:4-carboxymuconolactone decarboxylase
VHGNIALASAESYSMTQKNASPIHGNTRLALGSEIFELVMGSPAPAFIDGLTSSEPDYARLILEWEFVDVYNRPGLDLRTRELVVIAGCAALGATGIPAVRKHISEVLRAGATRQDISEVLIQLGFPAGLLGAPTAAGKAFEGTRVSNG